MADYHYHLEVYSCREKHNVQAVGEKNYEVPGRNVWTFTHTEEGAASAAAAKTAFLAAFDAALPDAPDTIKYIKASGTGSLNAALTTSATATNDGVATSGPWNERSGKDVLAYKIGVSTTSAADALSNLTAHNLS